MELNSAVIAIGGNLLIVDPRNVTLDAEYEAARETCEHIAGLVADCWQVIIGHGNGPQVGFNLRRSELAAHELFELPWTSAVPSPRVPSATILENGGRRAIITNPPNLTRAVAGAAGTEIVP